MALATPREIVQARAPTACLPALADVQQARLVPRPEPVDAWCGRNEVTAIGLIEVQLF
jgi:hypothetical protein